MPNLDLTQLPAELQAALERAWPGCPEAQRRALLAPWAAELFRVAWPDHLWIWQPSRRWWRPNSAREWRNGFDRLFSGHRGNFLESKGPPLFSPEQPFFETPWTHAEVLLRSPEPEVFTNAEYWAIAMQFCDGDLEQATWETRTWAQLMVAKRCVARGSRRDNFWIDEMRRMELSATGTFT